MLGIAHRKKLIFGIVMFIMSLSVVDRKVGAYRAMVTTEHWSLGRMATRSGHKGSSH